MRKPALILLGMLLATALSAQGVTQKKEKLKRGYIGISVGPAIPLGEFGSTDINSEHSGFAKTGVSLQLINFGLRLNKNFGIAAMWSGAAFNVDEEAMKRNAGLGTLVLDSDPWAFGALMGGLFVSIPSKVLDVDFRVMFGLGYGKTPEINIYGNADGGFISLKQESDASNSIAYSLGLGLRFNVARSVSLNLLFDFVGSKQEFEVNMYSGGNYLATNKFEQPMNFLTITGGIGIRLN